MKHSTNNKKILNIRTPSGISGDMLVCGLAKILGEEAETVIHQSIQDLDLGDLDISFAIAEEFVNHIQGYQLKLQLPHEHKHRTFADIKKIISHSKLAASAKEKIISTFHLLAEAEAAVHGKHIDEVHFHEVGALDSILDISLTCILFEKIDPDLTVCSPLPLADGSIHMAHGHLSSPAPAVLRLLQGVPVYGVEPEGETVTPTAIALLKSLNFQFGNWPEMSMEKNFIIYGGKRFQKLPNGAIFSLGIS